MRLKWSLFTPFETCQKEKYVCNHFCFTTAIVCTVIFAALYSSQRADSENDSVLDDSALDDSERDDSQRLGRLMAQGVCVNRQYWLLWYSLGHVLDVQGKVKSRSISASESSAHQRDTSGKQARHEASRKSLEEDEESGDGSDSTEHNSEGGAGEAHERSESVLKVC